MLSNFKYDNFIFERIINRFWFVFTLELIVIYSLSAIVYSFLDNKIISFVNLISLLMISFGYAVIVNFGSKFSYTNIHNLAKIPIFFSIILTALFIGNNAPTIYLWFITEVLVFYLMWGIKKAALWACICLLIALIQNYISMYCNLYVVVPLESDFFLLLNCLNIVFFVMVFITILYFFNEFQNARIINNIRNEETSYEVNLVKENNGDDGLIADNFNGESILSGDNVDKYENIYSQITKYFQEQKTYRDQAFNSHKMAFDMNINLNLLTKVITYKNGYTIKMLANYYRVQEIKQRLNNLEHEKYNLKHIYMSSGFKSQPTFNRAFKEIEGITPSEFIERLKK